MNSIAKSSIQDYHKYFYVGLFLILAYLVYRILQPFLAAIIVSMVLAYILHPVYKKVNVYIKNRNAAALITALLVIILISVPLFFVLNTLTGEAKVIYVQTKQVVSDSSMFGGGCLPESEDPLCTLANYANHFLGDPQVKYYMKDAINKATNFLLIGVSDFVLSLPRILLNIFVALFTLFYLFKEGPKIVDRLGELLPFQLHHQKEILKQIDEITYAVIYGSVLIALIQGTLAGIVFWIFGVGSPVFWGMVMVLFAFVPFVGASLIWFPAAVIKLATGHPGAAIGIWVGGFIISWVDNLIKPKLVGSKAGIHPVLVLLGVLGGLATFGLVGGILGPLVLALFITFLKIYHREKVQGY